MASEGVPQREAMQLLGHSTMAMTTEVYQHVLGGRLREAASRIDRLLSS